MPVSSVVKFQYQATPDSPIVTIDIINFSYYFNKVKFTAVELSDQEMFEMDTEVCYVLPDEELEEIKIKSDSTYVVLKDKPWCLYYKDCIILEFNSVGFTWDQEKVKVIS